MKRAGDLSILGCSAASKSYPSVDDFVSKYVDVVIEVRTRVVWRYSC